MTSLFAYGTLRDPDVLESVVGHSVPASRRRPALAPGYEVVFFPGRSYPAIRRRANAVAPGTLIEAVSTQEWRLLDPYEGEEYHRAPIEIIVDGRFEVADAYWPGVVIKVAPSWRFEDWQAHHKAGLPFGPPIGATND
jgi:Gamma-glutamyl cyclotransferase, AIG2-like